ncbi:MAG: arsenic efflux protein [Coprococcus sp.]|nr:arsenic efflux protein [Coprococcus sp.]
MKLIMDSGLDALLDCIKLVPFLLVTYLLMEWLERKTEDKQMKTMESSGIYGPFVGGLLGVVPQCGFSLAAANLYSGGVITVGVLLAVFMSTSDEMLPIFLSHSVPTTVIIKILLTKAIIAIVTGYAVDMANKGVKKLIGSKTKYSVNRMQEHVHSDENHIAEQQSNHMYAGNKHHHGKTGEKSIHGVCENEHCNCQDGIIKSSIKHTVKIALFIVVISFAINIVIGVIGEESIQNVFSSVPVLGEAAAALVGLIPNCAASVIITQLYLEGVLNAGAMMSGLLVSAGVGLMVLFRMNKGRLKENMKVLVTLYAVSIMWGVLINLAGLSF